jgi:hypothetical protein
MYPRLVELRPGLTLLSAWCWGHVRLPDAVVAHQRRTPDSLVQPLLRPNGVEWVTELAGSAPQHCVRCAVIPRIAHPQSPSGQRHIRGALMCSGSVRGVHSTPTSSGLSVSNASRPYRRTTCRAYADWRCQHKYLTARVGSDGMRGKTAAELACMCPVQQVIATIGVEALHALVARLSHVHVYSSST